MDRILISDTHLGLKGSSDIWLEATLNLFREVADLCLSKDINTIYHLGDFFDKKRSTNQKALDYAYDIMEVLKPLSIIIITGNHDIFYKEKIKPSSLKCFDHTSNVTVITEPRILNNDCLIPWKTETPSKGSFCFGHFEINDFHQNDTSVCYGSDLNAENFKGFNHVYSGHFHTPSSKGNITYIGSAFQQTFNDVGSSRGYYILSDNGDLEFIEYKGSPKFLKLHTEGEIKDVEGNIVRLIYDKDYGTNENNKILEEVERMNPLVLKPNFTNISCSEEEYEEDKDISIIEHNDIMAEYIKKYKVPENIDKKILLKIMLKMVKEEEEEE